MGYFEVGDWVRLVPQSSYTRYRGQIGEIIAVAGARYRRVQFSGATPWIPVVELETVSDLELLAALATL